MKLAKCTKIEKIKSILIKKNSETTLKNIQYRKRVSSSVDIYLSN